MTTTEIVTTALAIASSNTLSSLITRLFLLSKNKADASSILAQADAVIFNTLKGLIEPLNKEIERLSRQHGECEQENAILRSRILALEAKVRSLENPPPPLIQT
jgi:hypothetical protein